MMFLKKRHGKVESVTHAEPIADVDWKKLNECFRDVEASPDAILLAHFYGSTYLYISA